MVGTLAIGQTIIILTAGVDLSVGAIAVFASIVMANLNAVMGIPGPLALLMGFVFGTGCGLLNGWLITRFKMPPFIVTLGTLSIFYALDLYVSGSATVRGVDMDPILVLPGQVVDFLGARFTLGSMGMLVAYGVMMYILRFTAWGRHVFAVGDDRESARLSGVRTDRLLLSVYAVGRIPVRPRRLVPAGSHQCRQPAGAGDRQPRDHHRRGHRRHQPVRWTRWCAGHAIRCDHRRHRRERAHHRGLQSAVAAVRHRRPGHRRRRSGPVDQKGREVTEITRQPILEGRDLVKSYGRVVALDHAEFDLYPGEVLGVIGDNGAGKSTLIKCFAGAVIPDQGEILMDGQPVRFQTPNDAKAAGIETVYQTLAVCPALDIATNLFLGRERRRAGIRGSIFRMLDLKGMRDDARMELSNLGLLTIQDMSQAVETLSGGQRQGVAVARAAAFGSRVIIMDEPTAALGVKESGKVLQLIRDVRDRGLPVILISHNMPHVFEVADRIHIHRLGRRVAVVTPASHTMTEAVAIMTGATRVDTDHGAGTGGA